MPVDTEAMPELIARLHVARWSGKLPADLGDALLDLIGELESSTQRRASRDAWLRRAGERFSGSAWVRAGIVRDEMLAQVRERRPPLRDPSVDWRGCVRAALLIDRRVPSRKQLARILDTAR